ncbi:MAG: hypothetical protein IT314_09820 [Anaerolineales bacterium]|nr:hypothetical protein [Anaerolineales bacterium]
MENTTPAPPPAAPVKWRAALQRLLDNPIAAKELRGRMRGIQSPALITVYLCLIAVFILFVYGISAEVTSFGWNPSVRQDTGKAIFGTVVLLELLFVSFIAPGLTSSSIAAERERQTYDLLRTTLLSGWSLVSGKLGSALAFLFLLILTALPVQSLAFLLGGVEIGELIVSSLMLAVTAVFFCALGLFFSSFMQRTIAATVSSYGATLLSFLGIAIIFFMVAILEAQTISSGGAVSDFIQFILASALWLMLSLNPFTAAFGSEMILVNEQSLFITKQATSIFGDYAPAFLPSPWILYVILYVLLTMVLILLSIRNVNRIDR